MRTLFVGDLHAKADLLPLISRVAQRENTDRMVLLGDVCDDWNVSNNGLIRFFETFTSWYRREAGEREVIPLLRQPRCAVLPEARLLLLCASARTGARLQTRRPIARCMS